MITVEEPLYKVNQQLLFQPGPDADIDALIPGVVVVDSVETEYDDDGMLRREWYFVTNMETWKGHDAYPDELDEVEFRTVV